MPRPSIETARGWRKKTLVDREGAPLGHIVHIYLDQVTGEPEWALVATGQGGRQVFAPLIDAAEREDKIGVPLGRALVSDAPAIRAGRKLSKEDTARLHGHYGGAPELRWGSARRMPGGGPSARIRHGLDRARERVPSPPAAGSPRTRRLLAAAAASVAGGLLVVRRRRRQQPSGPDAAIGRAVASVLAVPAAALRRRRRRRRLHALAGTATAPFAAAGRAAARVGRGVPTPTRTPHPRTPWSRRRRMAGNLKLLAGLAAGYILGAKAGRERYERIAEATRRLAERPEIRELTGKVQAGLGAGLERAASTASDRLQQVRGEDSGSEGQARATSDRREAERQPASGGKAPQAEAAPPAGEAHGRTPSPRSEVGEADRSGRRGGGASPEPGPSTGPRERSRSRR